jgi:hypothetical protein
MLSIRLTFARLRWDYATVQAMHVPLRGHVKKHRTRKRFHSAASAAFQIAAGRRFAFVSRVTDTSRSISP